MSNEDWKPIEKIIYDLKIWDDGVRAPQTPPGQDRMIIAETLLRIPKDVREKVVKEAVFITIGGAYGTGREMFRYGRKKKVIILINFSEMEHDKVNEEEMRITVAHEIAHFILGHHKTMFGGSEVEKEADDLIVKWGFKRAYQSYERFAKRRVREGGGASVK